MEGWYSLPVHVHFVYDEKLRRSSYTKYKRSEEECATWMPPQHCSVCSQRTGKAQESIQGRIAATTREATVCENQQQWTAGFLKQG